MFVRAHSEVSDSYITLLWGPRVLLQNCALKFPQLSCSFASQQQTDVPGHSRGWGWGGGVVTVRGAAAGRARVPRDWGRPQTQFPPDELPQQLRLSMCEGCWTTGACRLAGGGGWVCPGSSLLPLPDPKCEERRSPGAGCLISSFTAAYSLTLDQAKHVFLTSFSKTVCPQKKNEALISSRQKSSFQQVILREFILIRWASLVYKQHCLLHPSPSQRLQHFHSCTLTFPS